MPINSWSISFKRRYIHHNTVSCSSHENTGCFVALGNFFLASNAIGEILTDLLLRKPLATEWSLCTKIEKVNPKIAWRIALQYRMHPRRSRKDYSQHLFRGHLPSRKIVLVYLANAAESILPATGKHRLLTISICNNRKHHHHHQQQQQPLFYPSTSYLSNYHHDCRSFQHKPCYHERRPSCILSLQAAPHVVGYRATRGNRPFHGASFRYYLLECRWSILQDSRSQKVHRHCHAHLLLQAQILQLCSRSQRARFHPPSLPRTDQRRHVPP